MTSKDEPATQIAERELVIERVFEAPREMVFDAWTDPEKVVHWWGPRGFTTTVHEMDVRPGGVWRFIMHGPDGTDYHNRVVYEEVVAPERLVYTHGTDNDDNSDFSPFQVTMRFEDEGGRTRLKLRMRFASAETKQMAIDHGAREGGLETLERLAEYLAEH